MFYQPMLDVIMLNHSISPREFMVFCTLAKHMDKEGGNSYPSTKTIAFRMGITERSVQRCVSALEEQGYITTVQRKRTATVYTIGDKLRPLLQR